MANYFDKAGFCFIKFNFSYNGGTMNQPIDFPDLKAFGENNYTKELNDLNSVIDWCEIKFNTNPSVDYKNIILIGHSRGGGISLIKAEEEPKVKGLISLASVSDYKLRFPKGKAFLHWKESGVYYVENGRTKQQMPHFFQYFKDFMENENRLTIKRAAKKLTIPHLIIHGENDTSVKLSESLNLHKWNPKSQLEIIEKADHVFNTKQPWENPEMSFELKIVCQKIHSFLKQLNTPLI